MKPLLRRGALTGRVYIITRYHEVDGYLVVHEKVDVTDQYEALRKQDSEQ